MMLVRDSINGWAEERGMMGDIQGDFRRGRRSEDNQFRIKTMIEMTKVRK